MDIGVDLVKISRFQEYSRKTNPFLKRFFTDEEIDYCFSRGSPEQHLAGKFACKEAIIKAINNSGRDYKKYLPFEILNMTDGRPFIKFSKDNDISDKLKITLSHDYEYAVAFAVIK